MSETLKGLIERWRMSHEEGMPIGSKGAFIYEIENRCADELEAALPAIEAEIDQKWIDAFGAQDLQPRVTPDSLANWVFRDVQQQLHRLDADMAKARLEQSLRFAAEIDWWHRNWHWDQGIPCDGTMEVCKRHETCRTSQMPALADRLQEARREMREDAANIARRHQTACASMGMQGYEVAGCIESAIRALPLTPSVTSEDRKVRG